MFDAALSLSCSLGRCCTQVTRHHQSFHPHMKTSAIPVGDSFTHMLCNIEKKVDIWDKVFSVMLHCPISHISPERGLWLCSADCDKWLTVSFDGLVCNVLFPWRSLQVSLLPSLATLSCSLSLLWPVPPSSPFPPHPLSLSVLLYAFASLSLHGPHRGLSSSIIQFSALP